MRRRGMPRRAVMLWLRRRKATLKASNGDARQS
jgi:hypothetical protein